MSDYPIFPMPPWQPPKCTCGMILSGLLELSEGKCIECQEADDRMREHVSDEQWAELVRRIELA